LTLPRGRLEGAAEVVEGLPRLPLDLVRDEIAVLAEPDLARGYHEVTLTTTGE
jgi:hypothetical protein